MKKIYRLDIIVAEADFDVASGMLALSVPFGWEEESLPTGDLFSYSLRKQGLPSGNTERDPEKIAGGCVP